MRAVWVLAGGSVGLVIGCVVGFAAAMIAMSILPSYHDGTNGMRELLVCLPGGAALGLIAGVGWGVTTSLHG